MTDTQPPTTDGAHPRRGRGAWRWLLAIGVTAALAAGIVLVFADDDGDGGGEDALVEVFQESIGDVGNDPFTEPVSDEPTALITTYATAPPPPAEGVATVGSLGGGEPGLYGGTQDVASCDAEQLVAFLESEPEKGAAWAGVFGIEPDEIAGYVGGLTSMVLPADTRVTNHGFEDGEAYGFQSVLQAGTAVLVDDQGVPRVRCFCGNPLLEPQAGTEGIEFVGEGWPTFDVADLRIVLPAEEPVDQFVLTDVDTGDRFVRPVGSDGSDDQPATGGPDEPPDEEPPPDDGLTGPLVAEGSFTLPPGPVTYTANRLTLNFQAEGGDVTGDAEIGFTISGQAGRGTADFTGTFDAEAGSMSGSFTSFGSFGGLGGGGSGSWTAQYDEAAGTVTGSISAQGGSSPFTLTVRAA